MPDFEHPESSDSWLTGAGQHPASTAFPEQTDPPPGVFGCTFCGNTKFRRSKVRFYDTGELLMLRLPVRCLRCNQRQYVHLVTAAYALPPRSQTARVDRGRDTWKAWTASEQRTHPLQRPLTTSIGTKATKLQQLPNRPADRRPQEEAERRKDDRQIW